MQPRLPAILSPLLVVAVVTLPGAEAAESWRPQPLPRDAEIRAALAAGPAHFADQAGVYVLTEHGYELARASKNGFHCLVARSHPGAFEPECFDAEGSLTLMQAALLRGELQMRGEPRAAIERAIGAAYADGRLRPPSRPGITYMLSPENRVPIDEEGTTIIPYRPHLMFFAPYLTNADLGSKGGESGDTVFVINEGGPGAYAIVPVATADGEGRGAH